MPTISVIVPVYRVEEYLPECVDSILAQTYRDFELILVDDGSPDNCGAVCDAYAAKDSRIRVIHQENQGLSGARNTGIDAAAGTFVAFIDSDDMVAPTYLEDLWVGIQQYGASASCCSMQEFANKEDLRNDLEEKITSVTVVNGMNAVLSIYEASGIVSVTACGKLFRHDLCIKNRFPVGKIHEDQAVVPILLYESGNIAVVGKKNYYYRNRTESITKQKFQVKRFDNMESLDFCIAYFQKICEDNIVKAAEKARKRVNGILVILAESEGVSAEIPKKYRLSRWKALTYCYKYASNDTYTWYLSKLYPKAVIIHEYFLKVRNLLEKFSS